jgi:hypothetical protein
VEASLSWIARHPGSPMPRGGDIGGCETSGQEGKARERSLQVRNCQCGRTSRATRRIAHAYSILLQGLLRIDPATVIGILFAATTVGGIFLAVDWCHVRGIFIKIGSAYAEILAVRVYPVPQFFICIPSLGIGFAVRTHEIYGKSVAVAAVRASTMV